MAHLHIAVGKQLAQSWCVMLCRQWGHRSLSIVSAGPSTMQHLLEVSDAIVVNQILRRVRIHSRVCLPSNDSHSETILIILMQSFVRACSTCSHCAIFADWSLLKMHTFGCTMHQSSASLGCSPSASRIWTCWFEVLLCGQRCWVSITRSVNWSVYVMM